MNKPTPEALKQMRDRATGGTWAAYENHDLGHPDCGHLRFLKYGPDCTLKKPPMAFPDSPDFIGWRYIFVGTVDLETGEVR